MSLLREIQEALLNQGDIGRVILKLRFLASRLGSDVLEEWVKHETEGYPANVDVPPYRQIAVAYKGDFSGALGSGIRNAPIPPYLIEKFAGEDWTTYKMRQSIFAVDDLVAGEKGGEFHIDGANLMLLLQGKVYKDYACNNVVGTLARGALVELQNAVRTRVLELTIKLERAIPQAVEISVAKPRIEQDSNIPETVTQLTQQVIHGNVTNISNTGDAAQFHIQIGVGDQKAFVKALTDAGIGKEDAAELGEIVAAEKPESKKEPFGKRAKTWIAKNIKKAADGTWQVGISVATNVLTEAAMRYYGLK